MQSAVAIRPFGQRPHTASAASRYTKHLASHACYSARVANDGKEAIGETRTDAEFEPIASLTPEMPLGLTRGKKKSTRRRRYRGPERTPAA